MAFSAGTIEAVLDLDRKPFQAGLDAAKAEAEAFANNRYSLTLAAAGGEETRAEIERTRLSAEEFARTDATAKLHVENTEANAAMSSSRRLAEDVGRERPTIVLDADTGKADAKIKGALAVAKAAERDAIIVKLDADKTQLDRKIAAAQAEVAKVKEFGGDIVLDGRIEPLLAKVRTAQAQVDKWKTQPASVELDAKIATAEANIARLHEEIQLFSERDYTLEVRALTEQAEAKLAALNAQAASLDRKRVELSVDATGTQAAAEGMSRVAMYAGIAAAAFPLVGAAVVALPGLIAAAAVPMAAVALGADGITAAFQRMSAPLIGLSGQIQDTFQQGLQPAVSNLTALLPTLQSGLTGTASSLSGMANNVTAVVTSSGAMRTVLEGVNSLITGLSPGISGLIGNLLGLAQQGLAGLQPLGAVFTQLSTEWQKVIDTLQRTGQGQAAVAALVQVLGGLLQLLPPLVQLGASLMTAIGPPLAAALQATAAVLTPIANLFTALPGPVQTAVAALVAFRIASSLLGSSGSEAAQGVERAAQSTSRLGSALGTAMTPVRAVGGVLSEMGTAFGSVALKAEQSTGGLREFGSIAGGAAKAGAVGLRSAAVGLFSVMGGLPGLLTGIATVGLGLLADHMQQSAQKAQDLAQASQAYASALSQTGGVITSVITKQAAQQAQQAGLFDSAQKLGISTQDVTTAITGQGTAAVDLTAKLQGIVKANTTIGGYNPYTGGKIADSMNATGQAAQDLLDKLNGQIGAFKSGAVGAKNLADAMGALGDHFGAANVAAEDGARTTALFAQAMKDAGDNSLSASDKVKEFAGAFQSASDVPRTFLESQLAANKAMTDFSKSLEKIPPGLVAADGAINSTSEAGQKLAASVLSSASAYDKLYGATFLNARQQSSDVPAALAKAATASADYRQKIIDEAVAHGQNRGAVQAMVDTLFKVPADVKTQIETPGMLEAVLAADGLKGKIEQLPGHKGIVVDTNSPAVIAQMEALGFKVTNLPGGKIEITAPTDQATASVDALQAHIDSITAIMKADADISPGTAKGDELQQHIDGLVAVMTADANSQPGTAKGDAMRAHIAGLIAVMTADANSQPGTAKGNALKGYIDRLRAAMTADANTAQAERDLNYTARDRRTTINVYEVLRSTVGSTAPGAGHALGAIVRPMEYGGMLGMAAGGGLGMGLTPMRSDVAQVVPPNSWRVIGDRMAGDEAFIPINSSARSQAILAQTASEMGWSLAPRVTGAALSGVASTLSPATGARRGQALVRGSDGAFSGDIVAAIRELRADVRALQTGKGDITINAPTYNPSAEPSSESQARALRTGAALVQLLPR